MRVFKLNVVVGIFATYFKDNNAVYAGFWPHSHLSYDPIHPYRQ